MTFIRVTDFQHLNSEDDVSIVVSVVKNFLNPFRIEGYKQQQLLCLSSGQPATAAAAIATDLLRYFEVGKGETELFVIDQTDQ